LPAVVSWTALSNIENEMGLKHLLSIHIICLNEHSHQIKGIHFASQISLNVI